MNAGRISKDILNEANKILFDMRLTNILEEFGEVFVTGSYFLNLMTWRDLDIYIRNDHMSKHRFCELGGKIASAFNPSKMNYRDEAVLKRGKPDGLYLGVYADIFNNAWKLDIFVLDSSNYERVKNEAKQLKQKISEGARKSILEIKYSISQNPLYRKEVFSIDIYKAVIHDNISSIKEFKAWIKEEKDIVL